MSPLANRGGKVPKSVMAGPPTAEQELASKQRAIAKSVAVPLSDLERYEQMFRPILDYDPKLADWIIEMLACGFLLEELQRHERWPGKRTFNSWMTNREFRERVTVARELGTDYAMERVVLSTKDLDPDLLAQNPMAAVQLARVRSRGMAEVRGASGARASTGSGSGSTCIGRPRFG